RVVVGPAAGTAARSDPAPALVPAQRLRLRELGAADDRAAVRGGLVPAEARARLRAGRAAHRALAARAPVAAHLGRTLPGARPRAPSLREAPVRAAAPPRARAVRRVDPAPPGGGRLLGRDPAAVGVLDHGAAPARLPDGPPRAE